MKLHSIFAALALGITALGAQAQLPSYSAERQVAGVLHVWGSPQMGDLLRLYEQGFVQMQPAVHFDNELKSTLTAVAGVYTGRAEIGLLGREIWPTEIQAYESIKGRPPMVVEVATGSFDVPKATFALMVFVPKSNPISSLSMEQMERIFSSGDRHIGTWGGLGLKGKWKNRPIHLYGFNLDNDKSQIFAQMVFRSGERWSSGLHEFNNASGTTALPTADAGQLIIQAVAADPDGIGISNVHYATPEVKALALSTPDHPEPITATRATIADRSYPLTRAVSMVVDADTTHPPSAAVLEFLRYVLSRQGRDAVVREGNYLTLPTPTALRQLQQLPQTSQ